MDSDAVDQILDELIPFLETLETQSSAILLFLKAKGMATDEELAPYFEQAGNMSSVRWRASRVRMKSVLSSAIKTAEQTAAAAAVVPLTADTDEPSWKPAQEAEGEKTRSEVNHREGNEALEADSVSEDKTRVGEEAKDKEKQTESTGSKKRDAA